jgi:hypothetical protein
VRHPLAAIPVGARRRVFVPLLVLTFAGMAVMGLVDRRITNREVPHGIVSLELAGTAAAAERMLGSWDGPARLWAAFSLGFDYLFLLLYSTTIALGCVWAASRHAARGANLAALGAPLAWGQWLAGSLDATENAALTRMLIGGVADPWPAIAWWAAVPKFVLTAMGLVYVLGTLLVGRGASASATSPREVDR